MVVSDSLFLSGYLEHSTTAMNDFDYQQLDDIIHSRIRLAIMALLASLETAEFTYIREKIGATDGNLSVHLKKLEEAEYISVTKTFVDRKPVTIYTLNKKGRKAFELYLERLEGLLKQSTPFSVQTTTQKKK
jgi:DNA-binding MarR family transcriptional regulator